MPPDEELTLVSEFLSFLTTVPSPSELAQVLTLKTLGAFEARSTGILGIDSKGHIELIGHFNFDAKSLSSISNFSVWEENAITKCIKSGKAHVLDANDRVEFSLNSTEKQLLAPINIRETCMGALLVSCSKKSPEKCNKFVETITKPIAQYLRAWQLENSQNSNPSLAPIGAGFQMSSMKVRQIEILNHMRDGLTTQQIAVRLGFSRSTIHQEIILIYRLLGVHNKHEALQKAFSAGLIESKATLEEFAAK
jgi:DNA-binding CsgD family transcriptional regulator